MIYLDNAATSFPKPESVYRTIDHVLRVAGGNPGRAGHRMAIEASRTVFHAREAISRLFGVIDSSRIVFTKNATEAINIGLKGFFADLSGHLVTTTIEHNAVAKTVRWLEARGVRVARVKPDSRGLLDPDEIKQAMTGKTRMVCVTHASNVYGTIEPVEEIGRVCRERGVVLMVDAAQTSGAIPIDIGKMNIDILAAAGHKALFGPQGTGVLYVREEIELPPILEGGLGDLASSLEMPERLEAGTLNTPGIGGLGAGAEFLLKEGVEKIRRKELSLVEALIKGLKEIEGINIVGAESARDRAGLVAFNINGVDPIEAGTRLDNEFSVLVRCGTHCAPDAHREAGTFPGGSIRVSPGYFNTIDDITAFLAAVRKIGAMPAGKRARKA